MPAPSPQISRNRWCGGAGSLALLAYAALVLGSACSDDSPETEAATGGGSGSTDTSGTGGAGGTPVDPVIESVVAENPIVTGFPTTVIFAAVVDDPQGVDDIASGDLFLVDEHLASFESTGEPGHYRAVVELDDPANWPQQGFVVLTAWFYDQAGHSAEATPTIKIEPTGCSGQPDAAACRACFCEEDPNGCASYTQREYEHLYCGSTCSQDCAAFCQTLGEGNPDPNLITGFCAACMPSDDDQEAFESSCLSDIPDCFGFLVDLGNCPP